MALSAPRYGKYKAFLTDEKHPDFRRGAEAYLDTLEAFDPQDIRKADDLSKAWRTTTDRLKSGITINHGEFQASQMPNANKRAINAGLDHWLDEYEAYAKKAEAEGRKVVPYSEVAKKVHDLRFKNVTEGKRDTVPATLYEGAKYDPVAGERLKMQRQFDIEGKAREDIGKHAIDRFAELAARSGGQGGGQPAPSLPMSGKQAERVKRDILMQQVGLSRTAADKLLGLGLDPSKGPQTIDAGHYNLNNQTISKLVAAGYRVKGSKAVGDAEAGYSRRELLSGRPLGSQTAEGETRLLKKQGLFRQKTHYEDDGKGNVRGVPIAPKYTGSDVKASVRRNTVGALGSGWAKWRESREEKKLNKPRNKILRTEELLRNERIAQLRGRAENSSGLKRSWNVLQLKIMRWTMTHKAAAILLVGLSIAFIPWFGVLTYTGYGLATLAMTFLEFIASVLVNVYNVMASIAIGAVSFLGNAVAGGFESASNWVLTYVLHLEPIAVDCQLNEVGERVCQNERLFSYTPVPLEINGTDIFPDIPKPKTFDDRFGVELILELFGVRWGIFNDLRQWVRGAF